MACPIRYLIHWKSDDPEGFVNTTRKERESNDSRVAISRLSDHAPKAM
jgi:hypothetical protein